MAIVTTLCGVGDGESVELPLELVIEMLDLSANRGGKTVKGCLESGASYQL